MGGSGGDPLATTVKKEERLALFAARATVLAVGAKRCGPKLTSAAIRKRDVFRRGK